MRVKLILPYMTILDKEVEKITAPGIEGEFQILPKHIDATWSLKPGILTINTEKKLYFAINTGVVVKQGDIVYISVFQAIPGDSLRELSATVKKSLTDLSDRERKAKEVLVKLEAETIKKFTEIDF
jgi:F-type H+-transporting ATPase subunit epsilon